MSTNVANDLSPFRYKTITSTTWGATANTCTITDPNITTNSEIRVWVNGTTPAAGRWSYTYSVGSVAITSSDGESSTLALRYYIV